MRVLFASPIGRAGGIARCTGHILDYYSKIKDACDVEIELLSMSLNPNKDLIHKNLWNRIKKGIVDYFIIAQNEKKLLKAKQYDIIHIASSASISLLKDLYMIRIAHKRGVKVIIHFHFGRIPILRKSKNWEWKLLKIVIRSADQVIVIDQSSYEVLVREGFTNVYLLPNPVSPNVQAIVSEHNSINREERTILFVGHGCRTKGIYELVEACSKIPNIKVKMIGSILESTKEELYNCIGNAEWLNIVGEIPYNDVIVEMCKCDLFVLPTYTEGFPNVILESMACACPIITTPVGAIPEMLDFCSDNPCGVSVSPKNIPELRAAIEMLLSDEPKKHELGQKAQIKVNEFYSMSSIWNTMVRIWKSCI